MSLVRLRKIVREINQEWGKAGCLWRRRRRRKGQVTDGERILANHAPHKGWVSRLHKKLEIQW